MKKFTKKVQSFAMRVENALVNKRGETTVGSGVAILTAVVLGALLLAGLYTLLGDVVMPALTTKIQSLFLWLMNIKKCGSSCLKISIIEKPTYIWILVLCL